MSKFTPGPYRWDRHESGSVSLESDIELIRVATVHKGEKTEANLRLLSAAPDMLEQLKKLVFFYEQRRPKISLKDGYPDPSGFIENLDWMIPHLKAVIAKAEGREE